MILYDIDTNEIINIVDFICEEDQKNYQNTMLNITIKLSTKQVDYIKDWYLLTINGGRKRNANEYKRDLYYRNSNKVIKLLNCFIKAVNYDEVGFISAGIYCDHYIIGDDSTFPEFKEIYRNSVIVLSALMVL
jgi:hypothetical protein